MKTTAKLRRFLLLAGSSLLAISSASAGDTWDGGGANNLTSTQENWNDDIIPPGGGGFMRFSGNTQNVVVNDFAADTVFTTLNFQNNGTAGNTNSFNLSGNRLILSNIQTFAATGPLITDTMSTNVALNGNLAFTINQGHDLIFSGNVTQLSGARQVVKDGAGTLTITGLHDNTNTFTINRGTANVNTIFNSGVASSVGASNQINFNANNNTAVLNYTGVAQNTDRKISMGNTGAAAQAFANAGSRINNNGSGALVFTNANFNTVVNVTATSSRTLFLGGANTAANQISGVIANNTGEATGLKVNLTKEDAGTWILAGNNTYTGATTISGGTLSLNRTTGSLNAATTLTFTGTGTFNMHNTAATGALTQTLGALTFSGGEGKVQISRVANQNQLITFASLAARAPGATGNFIHTGGTNGTANGFRFTAAPTAGTLFDPGLFFNGSSYATYNATGYVRAFTTGDTNYLAAPTAATIGASDATKHVDLTTGNITAQTTVSANTINMRNRNIVMSGTSQILSTNGLLSSGSTSATLGGGTTPELRAGSAGGELVVRVNGASDLLTVSSAIVDHTSASRLTKSGDGTLTLTGANTYTGDTAVNAGKLLFSGTGSLNGGSYAGAISTGTGATLQKDSTGDQTLSGNITGSGGIVMNSSGAKMTLSGANNTYTGATLVSAGTLLVTGSLVSDVTVSDTATVGGGGTVGKLSFAGASLFDLFEAVTNGDSLTATTISFASAGFGIDNLVANGSSVNWGSVANGTYTLITGNLLASNLDNLGLANAASIGGGRSAYFQSGSLQLVVVPEPSAALLGGLGMLLLLRRRRA